MYIFEIFFKRRNYSAIFAPLWKSIGDDISLSQAADTAVDPQLELFYFVTVYYAAVYHAAIAAGMSSSSAHYLARIQTQKSKIDKLIVSQAQEVFSAPDEQQFITYAEMLNTAMQGIVSLVEAGGADAVLELKPAMRELAENFVRCEFSVSDISRLNN